MKPSEAKLLIGLLHPLEFASGAQFKKLQLVKNLKNTLEGSLARFGDQLSVETRNALAREIPQVDSLLPEERKASIRRLLSLFEGASVSAPTSTPAVASVTLPSFTAPISDQETVRKGKAMAGPANKRGASKLTMSTGSGTLSAPLKGLKLRISPKLVATLNKKQLLTVGEVLFLVPRSYEDRRTFEKIAHLSADVRHTILVEVRQVVEPTVAGGRRQFRAILADASGSIAAVYFQSAPWLRARFPIGKKLVVSGEVRRTNFGWEMPHPDVEPADDALSSPLHFGRVVPVYPGFERYEQRALRQLTFQLCERFANSIEEPLPQSIRSKYNLVTLSDALAALHFPPEAASLVELEAHADVAHKRLAFDELFFLQLRLALRRQGIRRREGHAQTIDSALVKAALALLPFSPTGAQRRAMESIFTDLSRPEPMNRLLQGDVGSGKTAVALLAAAATVKNGLQVAVMAPTELLAQQLHANFVKWFGPWNTRVELLTGSMTPRQKALLKSDIVSGSVQVVVGTHALFVDGTEFESLGLVVIDEQHRFGVLQRRALMTKGKQPDVLVMTATPIPRTLAMTLYGDLDVSILNELPPGRTPIVTKVFRGRDKAKVLQLMGQQLTAKRQVYVVYPLVEESEKIDLKDATQGAAELSAAFPQFQVALLHGRMKANEKEQIMSSFRAGHIDVLVSTTVIEVGVDVPNATVMLVEHAERFGLSQLHQLRGRVGRGAAESFCFLVPAHTGSETAAQRLEVMERTNDGFEVAEADLEIRGPGEFLGTRQSGMPELAIANVVRDSQLLAHIQAEARQIAEGDPQLALPQHHSLARALEHFWGGRLAISEVG